MKIYKNFISVRVIIIVGPSFFPPTPLIIKSYIRVAYFLSNAYKTLQQHLYSPFLFAIWGSKFHKWLCSIINSHLSVWINADCHLQSCQYQQLSISSDHCIPYSSALHIPTTLGEKVIDTATPSSANSASRQRSGNFFLFMEVVMKVAELEVLVAELTAKVSVLEAKVAELEKPKTTRTVRQGKSHKYDTTAQAIAKAKELSALGKWSVTVVGTVVTCYAK